MRLRQLITSLPLLCLVGLSSGCFSEPAPAEPQDAAAYSLESGKCITPQEAERMADQLLELVNLERAEQDLRPVAPAPRLKAIAEDYACRMVNAKFFGHRDPITGAGPAQRAIAGKYTFYAIGENLAAGPTSAAEVMKLWMESPSHRDIILDPTWTEVGLAVRNGGEYSVYWVQEFGDPADF